MEHFESWNSPEHLWIFDFDLTMYDSSEIAVLQSMDYPMNEFIQSKFQMSLEEANQLRRKFWKSYGTTLAGLRAEFEIDPHDFFDYIHSHPQIILPKSNENLAKILERLKSEKWIFTNGRRDWAEIGLEKLGVRRFFTKLFDLEDSNWLGKPHADAYKMVQDKVSSELTVVFLDDSYNNLITAKEFGWKTVWMQKPGDEPGPFDAHLYSLNDLERVIF